MRRLGLLVLIGCSSCASTPDGPVPFEYSAAVGWSSQATPTVTSVSVDGHPVAAGAPYTISDSYAAFKAAQASFTDHVVVVKTSRNETYMFHIAMTNCGGDPAMFTAPIVKETDNFAVYLDPNDPTSTSLDFWAASGSCESNDGHVVSWAAR